MALISTAYSIGWYGVESESACVDFNLKSIGTYTVESDQSLTFSSSLGFDEAQASGFLIKYFKNGSLKSWTLGKEYVTALEGGPAVSDMECGQMYLVETQQANILNIPGFYPSAEGVDMGRVNVSS